MVSKTLSFITLAVIAVLLVAIPDNVSGMCCYTDRNGRCGDNSVGTPCCGTGRCNIFCCNCSGGKCWQRRSIGQRFISNNTVVSSSANEIVDLADVNDDALLSFQEVEEFLLKIGRGKTRYASFKELDLSNDELLSAEEIEGVA